MSSSNQWNAGSSGWGGSSSSNQWNGGGWNSGGGWSASANSNWANNNDDSAPASNGNDAPINTYGWADAWVREGITHHGLAINEKRDGWVCEWCHKQVNCEAAYHSHITSADHV